MATSGRVGAIYAPTTTNGAVNTTTTTDTLTTDGTTTTFNLANDLILQDSETADDLDIEWQNATVEWQNANYTWEREDQKKYAINYILGVIEFSEAPASSVGNFTVTYDYVTELEQVGGFFDWSFTEGINLEEKTEFGDDHISHEGVLSDWSGTADKYWSVGSRFQDWLGKKVIIGFYINTTTGDRFEGWGKIGSKSITCPHDTLVEENIDFEGQGFLEPKS